MILGIGGNYAGWNSDVLVLVFVGGELKEMKPIKIRSQLFNCNNKFWNGTAESKRDKRQRSHRLRFWVLGGTMLIAIRMF